MAISKAMRAALHTLSYAANIDVGRTYKVERVLRGLRTPLSPLYQLWDRRVERDGHEVRVRIYSPKKQTDSRLLLFFHGGGWVLESVDTYNSVCRSLARKRVAAWRRWNMAWRPSIRSQRGWRTATLPRARYTGIRSCSAYGRRRLP